MDLTLTSEEQAFQDEVRAWLGENHPGPEPDGEEAKFEFRRAWQRELHDAGWAGISWPKEFGGRGATLIEQVIFSEEMARAKAPSPANVLGLVMGGPGGDRARHRGAEGALPGADPLRRGDLVPGVLRAGVGLRPGVAEDEGGPATTAAGASPARRCGPPTRTRRSGACCWLARSRTRPSTRASPTSSATWSRTRSRSGRCARSPARPSSTRSSSRAPTSRTRTWSAVRGTAGTSRSPR